MKIIPASEDLKMRNVLVFQMYKRAWVSMSSYHYSSPGIKLDTTLKCTALCTPPRVPDTYHIPHVVGKPVDDRINTADKLQMLSFGRSFGYKKHDKAGGYKGHGDDDKDGDHKICALTPV